MKPQIKKLSAWLALFVVSGYVVCPTYAELPSTMRAAELPAIGGRRPMADPVATVNKAIGQVEKAEPLSQNQNVLSDWVTCKTQDRLLEGTVIHTGNSASTEIQWNSSKIITRIWQNSVVRLSPLARTVFITKGYLVFHKPPKEADCVIETKRLQARIHGTTVRINSDENVDTVLVLETHSSVEVLNKVDGSRVRLTPGIVLEVRGAVKGSSITQSQPIASGKSDLKLAPFKEEVIFQSKESKTVAFGADAKAILKDPLVVGNEHLPPIASIDQIRSATSKLRRSDDIIGNAIETAINSGKPDKQIVKNLKIECVPTKVGYYIGPNIGADKSINLPSLAYTDFHPLGIVRNIETITSGLPALSQIQRVAPVAAIPALPTLSTPAVNPTQTQAQFGPQFNPSAGLNAGTTAISPIANPVSPVVTPIAPITPIAPLSPITHPIAPISPMMAPQQQQQQLQAQQFQAIQQATAHLNEQGLLTNIGKSN